MLVIRVEREKHGWSQSELARRSLMHPSTVSQIENAKMVAYPSQLAKLAAALGWTADPARLVAEAGRENA